MRSGKENNRKPSRDRYDKTHPVVSIRIPEKVYHRLQEVTKATGMSYGDILKLGLGITKTKMKTIEEACADAYLKGIEEGYRVAEEDFKVTYRCNVCEKPIDIDTPEEKKAAAQCMHDLGWGHTECHERKGQR